MIQNIHHCSDLIVFIEIFSEATVSKNNGIPIQDPTKELVALNKSRIIEAVTKDLASKARSMITPNDPPLKTSSGNRQCFIL